MNYAVGPPELSPAARLLARTYENQALVFRDEQGQERVYCSICCEYGSGSSSRGYGYHSPDGSRNITVPAFEAHRGTKYHAKAVIAKEKGKQPLEPAVTAPEPVFGATSEQGSVTAVTVEVSLLQQLVTLMEKMKRWEHWEAETRTLEYQFSNDPRRFQFIHQTSFGRRHLRYWSQYRLLRLPVNFLQQFFQSVYQVDYLTLRHGFITAHFSEGNSFDFQKYIERALEKDFEVAVGMRLWIWVFSVLFIFFNAYVFHNYVWLPFIPLVMLLIVGTKLQGIITKMCLDTSDKSHVIQGTLLVRPGDHFFWFDRPRFLLHLMHLLLFQNSFQLAFFAWSWYKFGLRSCFHRNNNKTKININI
ncbi:MLO-like protein 6 [Salvia splendens]|uniref:MLO-like protein 6 n=1 Tax=Salvia splendens TaxID=180675 RepID=UPI001C263BE1|nr:MLO-like protein 6 [Salvia splendens]